MNGFGHPKGASMPTALVSEQCLRSQSGCGEAELPCPTCEIVRPSMTQTPQSRGLVERSMPTNLNSIHFPSSKEWFFRLRSRFPSHVCLARPSAAARYPGRSPSVPEIECSRCVWRVLASVANPGLSCRRTGRLLCCELLLPVEYPCRCP